MQNKCTKKWHNWRRTIVCLKARKTVTKNCYQRLTLFFQQVTIFLLCPVGRYYSPIFKIQIFLGHKVRKKKKIQAKELLISHFSDAISETQRILAEHSGFCTKFQPAVVIIPKIHSSGKLKLSQGGGGHHFHCGDYMSLISEINNKSVYLFPLLKENIERDRLLYSLLFLFCFPPFPPPLPPFFVHARSPLYFPLVPESSKLS